MSTSNTETNSQKDPSDDESDASFATVEEKDTGFTSKRNIQIEGEKPTNKKQKPDKDNCSDMELIIKQLTTVVRELDKHERRNVADVPRENRNAEIDGVIGSMICIVETAQDINNIPSEQLVFYEKLKKKREKQISNTRAFTKSNFLGWRNCETNVPRNLHPKQELEVKEQLS